MAGGALEISELMSRLRSAAIDHRGESEGLKDAPRLGGMPSELDASLSRSSLSRYPSEPEGPSPQVDHQLAPVLPFSSLLFRSYF